MRAVILGANLVVAKRSAQSGFLMVEEKIPHIGRVAKPFIIKDMLFAGFPKTVLIIRWQRIEGGVEVLYLSIAL